MSLNTAEEVISRVNKRIDETLCKQEDGSVRPFVCIICDKIVKPSTLAVVKKSQLKHYAVALYSGEFARTPKGEKIASEYRYKTTENDPPWMEDMFLSPRASYLGPGRGRGRVCGYSACAECKKSMDKRHAIPKHAIANKYFFGTPPNELLCLNDVELALLTPIQTYGYIFTYTGGKQRNLKGVLSYFRVRQESIATGLMQLEALGLNEHVVVLYTGEFTKQQRKKAKERSTIRVEKVLRALNWLVQHNHTWHNVNLDNIRKQLRERGPVVIDESTNVDSAEDGVNSNIETTETFVAYFPDGTMRTVSGGQANIDEFKDLVQRSKFQLQQVEFQCVLSKQAAYDYRGDNFVKACLLQFPYGIGGLHERRLKDDGSSSTSVNLIDYVQHLSYISQPHFHRPLFVLILYSIYQRQIMFKHARLNVRGDVCYNEFANMIQADDLSEAVDFRHLQLERRRNGYNAPTINSGTFISNKFLNSIDAVTRALPHSNAAARRARTEGECLCHYFGLPSVFLTFTPDDESSFLLQIFAGVTIDDDTPVETLTDEQLAARAKSRRELRIQNPGLGAFNFEIMLEIVLEEIVGVDMQTKEILHEGFFGRVKAVMVTVEEQGRTTLHTHILLWIDTLKNMLEQAQDPTSAKPTRERLQTSIAERCDTYWTTNLIGNSDRGVLKTIFKHDCSRRCHQIPRGADDQQLRNLRHRIGCAATEYVFAVCETCKKTWTHEEVVQLFLQNEVCVPRFSTYPDNCKRLNAMCIQYQKPGSRGAIPTIVNAAYNTHFSFHTKTCFPCNDGKKNNNPTNKKRVRDDDCRVRLPDTKRKRTCVNETGETCWYTWDGKCVTKKMIEINPRRWNFDEFQNVSCPPISESKMTCNSNIQCLSPGPIVIYCTKYTLKPTQKQDSEPYSESCKVARKMLSGERKHPSDRSEALRRLLGASFAHNKDNVVGPCLAAWLTRKGSRFFVSSEFAWCPLRDLDNLLTRSILTATLKTVSNTSFFENAALHYLCRPYELEDVDVASFYTKYEVRYIGRKKNKASDDNKEDDDIIPFENTTYYSHPSFKPKTARMSQGVRPRETPCILKLHQWYFPDSATFEGSILERTTAITSETEKYSRLVLMLFLPFRSEKDLSLHGSHTAKLRHCVQKGHVPQFAFEYLQNVQDARSNALRYPAAEDELARKTVPFQPLDDGLPLSDSEEEEDDCEGDDLPAHLIDDIIDNIFLSPDGLDDDSANPSNLDFSPLREKGANQCGFNNVVNPSEPINPPAKEQEAFVKTTQHPQHCQDDIDSNSGAEQGQQESDTYRRTKSCRDLLQTVFNFSSTRRRKFATFQDSDDEVDVQQANGSAASIIDWANKARLDDAQKRTFEILTASFVLTFYDEAHSEISTGRRVAEFLVEYDKLHCLSQRSKKKENLISFVHGPGGAGKSTIVDLVINYCEEYCTNMQYTFTSQTIVVTALTGVAATILLGDTTHRAVHLNRRKGFDAEDIEAWRHTRLLIVDEISFAPPSLFEKLDSNLRTLTNNWLRPYGGINVVFSGDLRQLKPVREESICDYDCPQFEDFVNCYIELDGKYRYKNDPEWGDLLYRFRDGNPTREDIRKINSRVCANANNLPPNIRYATYTNKDRDAINAATFSKYCTSANDDSANIISSAVIVLSDNLQVRNGKKKLVPINNRRHFWQTCGEDDVICKEKKRGRVDPALKLFRNCPVMLTCNDDVKKGKANGTRARVDHLQLKAGEKPFVVAMDGCPVPAVLASQVEYVELRHENNRIDPPIFRMKPRQYLIYAFVGQMGMDSTRKKDKDKIEMKIKQLPITTNTATTGHKLQGTGVDNLFVHAWSYKDNWPYVILSRVKTIQGLYLGDGLNYNTAKYAMPPLLRQKIDKFRTTKVRPLPSPEQYKWMKTESASFVGRPRRE